MRAGEPVRLQTSVDRFLSSPQRVDVGAIGGEVGRHLGTLGDGAVAGNHDIYAPGGLTEQDATVGEEDRGVADGVRLNGMARSARRNFAAPVVWVVMWIGGRTDGGGAGGWRSFCSPRSAL